MQQLNSISLMFMGLGLIFLGLLFENTFIKIVVLTVAAIINIYAAVKSFKEKKRNKKK